MFLNERDSISRPFRAEPFLLASALIHLLLLLLLSRAVPDIGRQPKKTPPRTDVTRILLQNPHPKTTQEEPKNARYLAETAHRALQETKKEGGLSLPAQVPKSAVKAHRQTARPKTQNKTPKTFPKTPPHEQRSDILASIPKLPSPDKGAIGQDRQAYAPNVPPFPSVEDLTKANREPAANLDEAIQKGELINLNTKEFKYTSYFLSIKRAVEGCMSYPEDMALQGISGGGLVAFAVEKDGSVSEVRVVRSSGHTSFDHEILRAIRMASPLNPIPKRLGEDRLFLVWPFEFVLYRFFS
jgi:protein TonB